MRKKPLERGYIHAQKEYERTGEIPTMDDEKYCLCSVEFKKGVEMFAKEVRK